jgi:hypothetical protein
MLLDFQSYHRAVLSLPPPLVPIAADLAAIPGDGLSDDHLSNRASSLSAAVPATARSVRLVLSFHRGLGRRV